MVFASVSVALIAAQVPLIATLYRLLGIDHRQELHDSLGRPHRIVPAGDIEDELLT